jgi:hypothetical protein
VAHLDRLTRALARDGHAIETLRIEGGQHSWLYEFPAYRRTVAAFLARALGGPLSPEEAAERAAAVDARRLPDTVRPPTQIEQEPGGFRSLVALATTSHRSAGVDREAAPNPAAAGHARAHPDTLSEELVG